MFSWTYMVSTRLAYLAVEECTVCFSLRGKKVSWNHNNPTETSHYIFYPLDFTSLPRLALFPPFPSYMIYSLRQSYVPSAISCCEEICLSPHGVNHDIMKKKLSLVCHMKHSDEKSLKTKTPPPAQVFLSCSFHFSSLF